MGCTSSTPASANSPSNVTPKSGSAAAGTSSKKVDANTKPARPAGATTLAECYKLGDILGEGTFGIVYLGTSTVEKRIVAVKTVKRANLPTQDEVSLRSEVNIVCNLSHPNVVRGFDFFEEEKNFYLVLEYLDGGELFDRIVKKTFYNEKEARDLIYILLMAIKYLHDKNIVHRDLKPENLLMTGKSDDANVKIADFGFATKANGLDVTGFCGTPGYMAPEIIENKTYGKPVDMWAFGVILYILLGGYPPFHDDNQRRLFRKIVGAEYQFHEDYWCAVSEEAKDLIRGLLNVNMQKRFTVDQCLSHPWLQCKAEELAARSLDTNLAELRKYQATRKLRAGVKAVMAVNRMKNLIGNLKEAGEKMNEEREREEEGGEEDGNQGGNDGKGKKSGALIALEQNTTTNGKYGKEDVKINI